MQTEQNNSQKEIQNKKSFKLKVKEWFTKKPNFLIRILIPTIIFAEILHYLLKEIIFLEAWAILTVFIISYIAIIVLFIAKKRDNFFVKHFILTFFLGVFLYNYVTYPSYTYRYRMTVEVETPEGLKTGSSVIEVHTAQWNSLVTGICNGHSGQSRAKGEGVLIEIEKGKSLLVLLEKGQDVDHAEYMLPYTIPMKEWNVDWNKLDAYQIPWNLVKSRKARRYYGTLTNVKGILPESRLPSMLSIIDVGVNDEIIVDEVNPRDMEIAFVSGVRFKDIIIETTDDDVGKSKIRDIPMWQQIQRYITYHRSRFIPYKKEIFIKGIFKPHNIN